MLAAIVFFNAKGNIFRVMKASENIKVWRDDQNEWKEEYLKKVKKPVSSYENKEVQISNLNEKLLK